MQTLIARVSTMAIILWAVALPVFAQSGCTGNNCLQNPLRFDSIQGFIEGVLKAIVLIALPIITAFMVYAGFKYIAARGNPGKLGKAHENFLYVLIGTALILGAWVLATLIGGTVSQLMGR